MDLSRVIELHDADRHQHGSGYLIADGLILTARHVVGAVGSECGWRAPVPAANLGVVTMAPWRTAVVAWVGTTIDAALLEPRPGERFSSGLEAAKLGFASESAPVPARAIGFPKALDTGARTDLLHVQGTVDPVTGSRAGAPIFGVNTTSPAEADGWTGMSGAGVFAGDVLLGVVEEVPVVLGIDALRIVGAQAISADEGAASRLANAGIDLVPVPITREQVDALPPEWRWDLLRQRYARAVIERYCRLDYAGLPGDQGSRPPAALAGFRGQRLVNQDSNETPRVASVDTIALADLAVVLGEPGSGKSTVLKQALALAAERDSQCVPVWLPISALSSLGDLTVPGLIEYLVKAAQGLGVRHANAPFFEIAGKEGRLVLAFDALDEAHEVRRPAVRDLVAEAGQTWPKCHVWLSSRPDQYKASPLTLPPAKKELKQKLTVWTIEPLASISIAEFLRVCFGDDGELSAILLARQDLAATLQTPQALSMIARISRARGGVPESRAEIFKTWIDVVCRTWEDAKKPASDAEVAARKKGLQLIAWDVQQRGDRVATFTEKRARRAVIPLFDALGEIGGEGLIRWLVERSGVLAGVEEDVGSGAERLLHFAHLQLQEYLAGAEFEHLWSLQRDAALKAARNNWWRDSWREMLRFAVVLLGDDADELIAAILNEPDPYEDLTRRRTLIAALLLSDLRQVNRQRVAEVAQTLVTAAMEAPYLYDDIADAIIALGRHEAAVQALDSVASGQLLANMIERHAGARSQDDQQRNVHVRLRAIWALAAFKGAAYSLELMEDLPWPNPVGDSSDNRAIEVDVLVLRYRLNDHATARAHLDYMLRRTADIREWQGVAEPFDRMGASAFVNASVDQMIREKVQSLDLSQAVWGVLRGATAVDSALLDSLLLVATQRVEADRPNFFPPEDLSNALQAALDLWPAHPLPQAHELFEATLSHPGLVWRWAYGIRQIVPDLARKALEAMCDLAADASLTDRSRRNGMVYHLCRDPDDELVVPLLLRLLDAQMLLLWRGDAIVSSLQSRGHSEEALQILKRHAYPDKRSAPDFAASAKSLAEFLKPGVTDQWSKEAGDARVDVDGERAPAVQGSMKRREPPLPSPTQAELESELSKLLKPRSRKTGAARRRVFRADPRDVTDKLQSMVDIGLEDTALAHASQWIADLDPDNRDETLELANRLLSLSEIGIWNASWSDVLARAVRSLKPTERGPWVPLMRQRL